MRQSSLLAGHSILIAEYNPIVAIDLSESLKEAGARIIGPALGIDEALDLLHQTDCCATIFDYRVGADYGAAFAHELYQRKTPFIIYSAYWEIRRFMPRWTGCRFITKPCETQHLIANLAELIRMNRLSERRCQPESVSVSTANGL